MGRIIICSLFITLCFATSLFAQDAELDVAKIMQDPTTWVGSSPGNPFWSEDGSTLYFNWNPQGAFPDDSLFKVTMERENPVQVSPEERLNLPPRFGGWRHGEGVYDASFSRKVFERAGDIHLYHVAENETVRLTRTRTREATPRFSADDSAILFVMNDNVYHLALETGAVSELTDIRSGAAPEDPKPDKHDDFLEKQQVELFEYIQDEHEEEELEEAAEERDHDRMNPPPRFYTGKKRVQQLQIEPAGRFVSFVLSDPPSREHRTEVQNYVTESGYAEMLNARPKVGRMLPANALYVQDLQKDTTIHVDLHQLPGSYDVPAYRKTEDARPDSSKDKRSLYVVRVQWSGDGAHGIVEVRARDNKDRWISRLDPETGTLTVLSRQHDEAWIAGPGVGWFGGGTSGWLTDNEHFYYQSEETGYSHLYTVHVPSGRVQALTSGDFEVFNPWLSKDGDTWYFTSSEGSPFERHFYEMPVDGGRRTRLTGKAGNNQVVLSPNESDMAMRYSYSNQPPEIYIGSTADGLVQVTQSTTEEWQAYSWRDPEIIHFEASDGVSVPARIYKPDEPNGAAVLFVHGAGYLQNVHRWWSGYFREYMFHNMLVDEGYTVLDVDYRASAGYGRDWRTAIYRYMGGRDLQDYVDASRYTTSEFGIDPERVFIYGGSYGGFITLMALFTEPEHFGGGAALRAVTDWAHYNHVYTSNILNTPATDTLAYQRSSPIYFAEGLEDPLLIAHGMVDTNVQFQDVVRLAQRLIELGKEDWEMAVYPIEGHGFTESASWTDEYRRIYELIEETVGPNRMSDVGEE